MATIQPCENPAVDITGMNIVSGNDLTAVIGLRYRKAVDPDIDSSYTDVTTTESVFGNIIHPFIDMSTLPPDTYVLHQYMKNDGTSSGLKMTVVVTCDDVLT